MQGKSVWQPKIIHNTLYFRCKDQFYWDLNWYLCPLRTGAYCFAHVSMLLDRPRDDRSISREPFMRLLYFIRGLVISRGWPLLIFRSINTVCSISWKLFAWQTSNLVHWYILKRLMLLILRSKGQGSNWTYKYTDCSMSLRQFTLLYGHQTW
jgi:hypothetical protein